MDERARKNREIAFLARKNVDFRGFLKKIFGTEWWLNQFQVIQRKLCPLLVHFWPTFQHILGHKSDQMSPVPCVFETFLCDSGGILVNHSNGGRITVHTLGWFCSKTVQKGQKCSQKSSFGAKKCQNDDNFVRRYRFAHAYAHQIQNHLTSSSNIV